MWLVELCVLCMYLGQFLAAVGQLFVVLGVLQEAFGRPAGTRGLLGGLSWAACAVETTQEKPRLV